MASLGYLCVRLAAVHMFVLCREGQKNGDVINGATIPIYYGSSGGMKPKQIRKQIPLCLDYLGRAGFVLV